VRSSGRLIAYFGCVSYCSSGGEVGEFIVTKFLDIEQKIIPFPTTFFLFFRKISTPRL